MPSKHAKAVRRQQAKGITYKLVHRPYEDKNRTEEEEKGMLWVKESELRRNHAGGKREGDEESSYYAYTNSHEDEDYYEEDEEEGKWEDHDAENFEDEDLIGHNNASHPRNGAQLEKPLDKNLAPPSVPRNVDMNDDTYEQRLLSEWRGTRAGENGRDRADTHHGVERTSNMQELERQKLKRKGGKELDHAKGNVTAADDDDDDKLFDDEVQCEVTDDFLRQLIFGSANHAEEEGDSRQMSATNIVPNAVGETEEQREVHGEGMQYNIPQDAWTLLTVEEKNAVRAANSRGKAPNRGKTMTFNAKLGIDSVTAKPYPVHDVTERAIDRQFTEVMREFEVDVQINDAYTDDPRTHGALPMDKYMDALKEFVVERAGLDYSTSEPARNKGFIHQLQLLSYRAGAFDVDDRGGVYKTTIPSGKEERFAEHFRRETERLRAQAALRSAKKADTKTDEAHASVSLEKEKEVGSDKRPAAVVHPYENRDLADVPDVTAPQGDTAVRESMEQDEDEEEEFRIAIIKSKDKQLDCEKAVSVFSSYFNQPNVIRPTSGTRRRRTAQKHSPVKAELKPSAGTSSFRTTSISDRINLTSATRMRSTSVERASISDPFQSSEETHGMHFSTVRSIPTVRSKEESKEEKKMRRQAVKAAQRERRQEKSALKKAYQTLSELEKKRSATSVAAKRTVHFM